MVSALNLPHSMMGGTGDIQGIKGKTNKNMEAPRWTGIQVEDKSSPGNRVILGRVYLTQSQKRENSSSSKLHSA